MGSKERGVDLHLAFSYHRKGDTCGTERCKPGLKAGTEQRVVEWRLEGEDLWDPQEMGRMFAIIHNSSNIKVIKYAQRNFRLVDNIIEMY